MFGCAVRSAYIGFSARAAEWMAGFSGGIGQEVIATIVYYSTC